MWYAETEETLCRFLCFLGYRPAPVLAGVEVRAYPVCIMESAEIPKLFPDSCICAIRCTIGQRDGSGFKVALLCLPVPEFIHLTRPLVFASSDALPHTPVHSLATPFAKYRKEGENCRFLCFCSDLTWYSIASFPQMMLSNVLLLLGTVLLPGQIRKQ